MDSINLCESPIQAIDRQAKQRLIMLMVVLSVWAVGVILAYWMLNAVIVSGERKIDSMKGELAHHQQIQNFLVHEKQLICAAQVLESLTLSSIQGVSLKVLTFEKEWEIQGRVAQSSSLLMFHERMKEYLGNIVLTRNNGDFVMRGSMKC